MGTGGLGEQNCRWTVAGGIRVQGGEGDIVGSDSGGGGGRMC